MSEVEAIAEVLELHSGRRIGDGWRECVCGQLPPLDPDAWRTHVAEQIAARLAAADRDTALRERVKGLRDNYHVRTFSFPNQRPQWADIEADLTAALDASPTGTSETRGGSDE